MSKALFVSRETVIAKSPLNGNIDPDKLMQYIELAQDIHIHQQLGTDLYEALQAKITGNTLAGVYLNLVENYIRPMLIHYAVLEYLHYAAYTISNGGVFKPSPENAIVAEKNEIDSLIEKQRTVASFYTQRFIDYMCANGTQYPEWYSNTNGDMYPAQKTKGINWVL